MKRQIMKTGIGLLLILATFTMFAQPPGGGGGQGQGGPPPGGTGAPVDTGGIVLLIAVTVYGYSLLRKQNPGQMVSARVDKMF